MKPIPSLPLRAGLSAAAVLLFSLTAIPAGVTIDFEHRSPERKVPLEARALLEPDRLRMEVGPRTIIYRGDRQLIWVIDTASGEYMEITRDQMQKLGAQAAGVMDQVRQQLETMSPEQRAMVEKMMGEGMPGLSKEAASRRSLRKSGEEATINGFACAAYESVRGGAVEQEIWVTGWESLGLKPADFAAFQSLSEFVEQAMGPIRQELSFGLVQDYAGSDGLPGVPVRTVTFGDDGKTIDEIRKISRGPIAAESFDLPARIKKRDFAVPDAPPGR